MAPPRRKLNVVPIEEILLTRCSQHSPLRNMELHGLRRTHPHITPLVIVRVTIPNPSASIMGCTTLRTTNSTHPPSSRRGQDANTRYTRLTCRSIEDFSMKFWRRYCWGRIKIIVVVILGLISPPNGASPGSSFWSGFGAVGEGARGRVGGCLYSPVFIEDAVEEDIVCWGAVGGVAGC